MIPSIPNSEERASASASSPRDVIIRSFEGGQRAWLWAILAFAALLALPSLGFERVFDDHLQIEQNRHIRTWKFIGKAFTEHVWSGQDGFQTSNSYRPFYLVAMTAQYGLFKEEPRGWHAVTILLALGAIAAFWFCAGRMVGNGSGQIMATIVFALHPTHVESTAWIAAFADPLVMIFFASALTVHLKSIGWGNGEASRSSGGSWRLDVLSAALLAGALLTKEFAVFWGPMVFVFHFVVVGDGVGRWTATRNALPRLIPQVVVTAAYLLAHHLVIPVNFVGNPELSAKTILLTGPKVLWSYVKLLVFPFNLRLEYELGYVTSAADPAFWLPLLLFAGIAGGILFSFRKAPLVSVLAMWIFFPLFLALNLRHFRPDEFIHDRYLYLPTLGFALLAGWGLNTVSKKTARRFPSFSIVTVGVVLVILGYGTAVQVPVWRNDVTLNLRILEFHPRNAFALRNLAVAYDRQGLLKDELAILLRAARDCPNEFIFPKMLGNLYGRSERYADVVTVLGPAFATYPELADDSDSCYQMGYALLRLERYREARPFAQRAVLLEKENPQYWYTLGDIQSEMNLIPEAVASYRKVIELAPSVAVTVRNRIAAITSPAFKANGQNP